MNGHSVLNTREGNNPTNSMTTEKETKTYAEFITPTRLLRVDADPDPDGFAGVAMVPVNYFMCVEGRCKMKDGMTTAAMVVVCKTTTSDERRCLYMQ